MSKILVAEDNAPNRDLMREIMESRGHEVIEARDGQEALDKLGTNFSRFSSVRYLARDYSKSSAICFDNETISTGLVRYPSKPASNTFSRSPCIA